MSCTIKRILQFNQAISYGPIRVFDGDGKDITITCMYSWSTDSVCWTNWAPYDTYKNVCQNIESDFYLRVLLFGSFSKISLNGLFTACYSITLDQTNQFLIDFCGTENLFNPYNNLDCALLVQQQMSDAIICMFGIPVYYFRIKPDVSTADYTFKEYVMHNVESVKQIQLMIQDGQMPSSKPNFTEWDFDWDVDSSDAAGASRSKIYSNVVNGVKHCSKCIVLMHDIKANTVNELDNILKTLTSQGYKFGTLNINSPTVHHTIVN